MKPVRARNFLFFGCLTVLLAACGGQFDLSVGGIVGGLSSGASIVLQNNGAEQITINANGQFKFPSKIGNGAEYHVTVVTQPAGETCVVANGFGNANSGDVSNANVTCSPNIGVGGTISGLPDAASVTLENNGADSLIVSANGSFIFPTQIVLGSSYNVTVFAQPQGENCQVVSGTGSYLVSGTAITNIQVICNVNIP